MHGYPDIRLLIGGQWRNAPGRPILNPSDESVIGHVPTAILTDLDEVAAAAARGMAAWRRTPPAARAEVMLRAADLLDARLDHIAAAVSAEQGKPLPQARTEVLRAAELLRWDASEAMRLYGRVVPAGPDLQQTVLREPIGVVAAFTPWNFPLGAPARKVGGALAAGCAIVLKAAEEAPAGAVMLAQAFVDAGLPAGVLNLVFGDPATIAARLIGNPVVRAVTFAGAAAAGRHLAGLAAQAMKPAMMELGGHAPVLICADADPEAAALACVKAKLDNAGQVCMAPTRCYVHAAVYDEFVAALARHGQAIRVGPTTERNIDMGPVSNRRRLEALEDLVRDAVECGARVLCGGMRVPGPGYLFPFTVLADVPHNARAMRQEPFGPLCLAARVQTLDEALERANSLPDRLAGYAFTQSAATAHRIGAALDVGSLSINHFDASMPGMPLGGVKESGYGREAGLEGVARYTHVKSISHRLV